MKAPITALSARATTGVCGQRLWGDIDLCDLLPDNMSTTLDVWEKELKDSHRNVILGDIFSEDKYIKYDLLANFAHEEGVPLDASVNLSIKGSTKEVKWKEGKVTFRSNGTKLYSKGRGKKTT